MIKRFGFLVIVVFCGCESSHEADKKIATSEAQVVQFTGVWASVGTPDKELYLGDKRWILSQRLPVQLSIQGNVDFEEPHEMSTVRDISVSATRDRNTGTELERFNGIRLMLIRENSLMRIETVGSNECELNGIYQYVGDQSPSKGFLTVVEWGATPFKPTSSFAN